MKPLVLCGRSRSELRAFPQSVRRTAGMLLQLIQEGEEPPDWKPMKSIGAGVCELRLRDASGAWRILYATKFEEAVYVLHCFQKKTQKTSQMNLETAERRYRELIRDLSK